MVIPQKALVLAAGLGTRLRPLTWRTPKPLLPVWGTPLLAHTLRNLEAWGVTDIVINTHWRPDAIAGFLAQWRGNARITTSHEPEILGTGGALKPLQPFFNDEPFWIVNADVAFALKPDHILHQFNTHRCIASAWLYGHCGPRTVENDASGRVTTYRSATPRGPGTATFAGVQIVSPDIFRFLPADKKNFSLIDAYEAANRNGLPVFAAHIGDSFWADIGSPDAYLQVHADTKHRAWHLQTGGDFYNAAFDAHPDSPDAFVCSPIPGVAEVKLCHKSVFLTPSIPARPLRNAIVAASWNCGGEKCVVAEINAQEDVAPREACHALGWTSAAVAHLGARGSNRNFWRVAHAEESAIVIDYTGERAENRRYAALARALLVAGVPVPRVLHETRRADNGGLLVLEDLGDVSLQHRHSRQSFEDALAEIFNFHQCAADAVRGIELEPLFDEALYAWEQRLFEEHLLVNRGRPGFVPRVRDEYARVTERLLASPQTVVHRDLQSTNLYLHNNRWHFIDFQGMRRGAVVYDLASFLCDPYIELDDRDALLRHYAARGEPSIRDRLLADFHWGAVQRLTQAMGAYGRLTAAGHADFQRHLRPAAHRLSTAAEHCGLSAIAEMVRGIGV